MSQFTDANNRQTLKSFIPIQGVYCAGRLDYDSEGLLVLTNDGALNHKISSPDNKTSKTYWAQVEGEPTSRHLKSLCEGVELKDGISLPAKVKQINPPFVWPRNPPIRKRKHIPTSWLEITITEGRNRQVRRMTAHVGLPTLRLIRYRVGSWTIDGIDNGTYLSIDI